VAEGFTKKYNITMLVYYETASDVRLAIAREKQLKSWRRSKKIALIESPVERLLFGMVWMTKTLDPSLHSG
jgi:predicted GIY-YIG superfamily endonuclease